MRVAAISGPDPGHLLPVVAVARALRRRGWEAMVATSAERAPDLEADGLLATELPGVAEDPRDADIGWRLWGKAAEMAPHLADRLRAFRPDVVVSDTLTSAGGFAADLLGVPWAEVVPHWLWAPSRALPPVGLGMGTPRTPLARLHAWHVRRQQARSVAVGERQRADARASLGLDPAVRAGLRLLATVPALEPPRPDWPRDTFVVGSLEWEPPSLPLLEPPSGDDPLVVITESTASNVPTVIAPAAVTGLTREAVRMAVTTTAPVPAASNAVIGRGRHGALLDVAACAVSPGGGGFVAKALVRGVPLVLVPIQGDQRETARRAADAGVAVVLPPEEVTPGRVRAAVREVLDDPSYRRAARRAGQAAAGLGAGRAADLIGRRLVRSEGGTLAANAPPQP